MRKTFGPGLALLLISLPIFGLCSTLLPQESQASSFADPLRSFEIYAREMIAYDRIPGLSIGFIKDDFTWAKGFGYADLENKVPAAPESSYRIASITKTITAIAVLQLVEEGKIDLDSEIQRYVPYFPRKKWPVTVRQLLGHIGGISHYKNYAVEGHIKEPKTTRESIAIFEDFDLVAEPGIRYNYSSYGYNLLGAAIEQASGLSYSDFIKKHIFDPLDMADSRLDSSVEPIPNRVRGYQITRGELARSEFVDISSRFAAAGVRSTVVDLLKYARGVCDGRLLQRTTWQKMFSSMAVRSGYFTWRGMGWSVQPWHGHFAASHSGSLNETRAFLLVFPSEKFAVAVACNLEGTNLIPYAQRLAELVLDEDIDSYAYAPDKVHQAIYRAVSNAFAYGLSFYEWNRAQLSKSRNDWKKAFDYFNGCVDEARLRRQFGKTRDKIQAGIHLGSDQAFTKVGSYMAQALENECGKENLAGYHKRGPLAFFKDYTRLAAGNTAVPKHPRFNPEFDKLIAGWEAEWNQTYTAEVQQLYFTPGSDFGGIIGRLKELLDGASLYPDFTPALAAAAEYFVRAGDPGRAVSILASGESLYPASLLIKASLGFAHFCQGEVENGRGFYRRAYDLDPADPNLAQDQFLISANLLLRLRRLKEALALLSLGLEFHPQGARLYAELGAMSRAAGQKDKAVEYYKKALRFDPGNEDFKNALKLLEKKGGAG